MAENTIRTADGRVLKIVGKIALREPDGSILPAQPIYAEVNPAELTEEGFTKTERESLDDFSMYMAQKMRQYIDGCEKAGVAI